MAFESVKPKKSSWAQVMTVREGFDEETQTKFIYVKMNTKKGRVIWQQYGGENSDDEDASTFYHLMTGNLKFAPDAIQNCPEDLLQLISVDLSNPKAAKKLDI